jgi:hypothetical protein
LAAISRKALFRFSSAVSASSLLVVARCSRCSWARLFSPEFIARLASIPFSELTCPSDWFSRWIAFSIACIRSFARSSSTRAR